MTRALLMLVCLLSVVSCAIPRDVEGTTEKATARGYLRAGAISGTPAIAVDDDGMPTGFEIDVVREYAESLGIDTEWSVASEHDLMDKLERGDLDVVVGGITRRSPWSARVALSIELSPSDPDSAVAAVRKGENRWLSGLERTIREGHP